MDQADQELIAEFVVEAQEGLAKVESRMLEIEAGGEDINSDLVNSVFRTMHSIKGSAGFLGFERIGSLAHGLEEVLDDMRNRQVIPTSELVTSVLRASDFMMELIDAVETSDEADVAPYIEELQRLRSGKSEPGSSQREEHPAAEVAQPSVSEAEEVPPEPADDSSSPPMDETVREFLIECLENLDKMDQDIVKLEQEPGCEQLLRNIFRTIHTVKGGAGFLGLSGLEKLTHAAENVLSKIRSGEIAWDGNVASALLATVDKCREGLQLVEATGSDHGFKAHAVVEQLLAIDASSDGGGVDAVTSKPTDQRTTVTQSGPQAARTAAAKAGQAKKPRPKNRSGKPAGASAQRPKSPTAKAPTTKTSAGEPRAKPPHPRTSQVPPGGTKPQAEKPPAARASSSPPPATAAAKKTPTAVSPAASSKGPACRQNTSPASRQNPSPAAERRDQPSASESTIRVDVALLDKLMTRVGELVLARNQILQYTNCQDNPAFASTAQRLNLITTEIQEDVMKTRMQPIGNVWAKFPRVVRDLSKQMGKQIRIEMEGKDTELDKTIVEAIKDPLTHLVRNSVDHGIESPDERVAAGKPAEGCLSLRAYHESGHVNIEISDDGAGLNLDRIRGKALDKGLISSDRAASMSEREAAQLILLPGFSTADQVSNVSGRGVGMDVVKTNIERISGTIDVQSEQGVGTTISIKIPLTLAIIPALVITNGGNRYAIPQVSLLELVRLEGKEIDSIELVHNSPVYRLRGTLLPLINLSDQLGLKISASDSPVEDPEDRVINIVVLRANNQQFGLIVDGVNDTEEIVVKPLSRQLKSVREYAGTTIMGDGTVALILDVAGLAAASGLAAQTLDVAETQSTAGDAGSDGEKQTLLIVDLGDSRRFALPTSMVARLEKVARTKIEHANGREVIQYRGAIMPLVRLAKIFGEMEHRDKQPEDLQIIVYADEEKTFGLVVNRIVDIVETNLHLHATHDENQYLLGSTVIQDRVTDVLNMETLARYDARSSAPQLVMN